MNPRKTLNKVKLRRKKRTRAKIHGTAKKPRFSVFRSHQSVYVQLIDDEKGKTLVSASTKELTTNDKRQTTKQNLTELLGNLIAKKAAEKKIKKVVFDRGGYKYHGRIKKVVEEARKAGLKI
ncbi:MAG: 50S ribosomal protein L18 [Candidatus Paceibacterota bacterium]